MIESIVDLMLFHRFESSDWGRAERHTNNLAHAIYNKDHRTRDTFLRATDYVPRQQTQ
jgi:hypothetical protein